MQVYSLSKLLAAHSLSRGLLVETLVPALAGMVLSFLAGLLALRFLSSVLERGRWKYFGIYCLAAAAAIGAVNFILPAGLSGRAKDGVHRRRRSRGTCKVEEAAAGGSLSRRERISRSFFATEPFRGGMVFAIMLRAISYPGINQVEDPSY